jgi:ribose/xylose/arabinose/galactoside ABC-type transport system permease subunit
MIDNRRSSGVSRFLSGMTQKTEFSITVFTLLVYCIFSSLAVNFNKFTNVMVIVQQVSINGIVALGVTIVIMIGGMDLSVGSILTLCGVCAGLMDNAGFPLWLVIVVAIIAGVSAGTINGFLITVLQIPDIIVTLATMNIYRGLAVIITGSKWVTGFTPAFLSIGSTKNGFLCVPVLIFAATIVAFSFMLRMMPFGRVLYALGGNRQAAQLMGLNVKAIRIKVYAINGLLLAFAGLILPSMIGNIQAATAASSLQFETMGSALIGGANIFGGAGSVSGTVAGVLLMGIIRNGLVQVSVSEYWLHFITGTVILLALIANLPQIRGKRRRA